MERIGRGTVSCGPATKEALPEGLRSDAYSGLVSEEPEKAATIAGLRTMATKVRPIRISCIGVVSPVWGSSELGHNPRMPQIGPISHSTLTGPGIEEW
jgi:hypothetical protein